MAIRGLFLSPILFMDRRVKSLTYDALNKSPSYTLEAPPSVGLVKCCLARTPSLLGFKCAECWQRVL
jgi:hypothetical protein